MSTKHEFESPHIEIHRSHRSQWLRAAVLGANDGIVSTSSLMLGVLAASSNTTAILTAGTAGLFAGALSMAAGEYVSVSSQRDSEQADIDIERKSLRDNPEKELAELAWIYEKRGLNKKLAKQVATELHAHDAVYSHARDELGIELNDIPNPTIAALASAVSFAVGAIIPILATVFGKNQIGPWSIVISSLVALAVFGCVGAIIGGGKRTRAALRVFIGGGIAMAITYSIGHGIGSLIS